MRRLVASLASTALAVAGLGVLGAPQALAASVPNLLSANQASVEAGTAGFAPAFGRERLARVRTVTAAHGRSVLAITSTTTRAIGARTVMAGQIATVGAVYSGSVAVRPAAGVAAPRLARAYLSFLAANGRVIQTVTGPWTATRAGRWLRTGVNGARAPAGTAALSLYVEVATTAKAQTYYADAWGLWRASRAQPWAMPPTTDGIAPTAPTLRTSVVPASTTIAVSFSSTDNVGVAGYRVWFQPGTTVDTTLRPSAFVTGTSFVRPSLAQGTYAVVVAALDRAGHQTFSHTAVMTLAAPPATANLLAPSEASFESGVAGIDEVGSPTSARVSLTRSAAAHAAGSSSLRIEAATSGALAVRSDRTWTPAHPGSDYAASASVLATAAGHSAQLRLTFYDAAMAAVGTTTGASIPLPSGQWVRPVVGANAPAPSISTTGRPAAFVSVALVVDGASGPAAGTVVYTDAWGVWASSSVPAWSLPTVPQGTVVAFIGDSYGVGVGAEDPAAPQYTLADRFTTRVARTMGWRELNLSRGATGFTSSTTFAGCGYQACGPYSEQVARAVAARPDVVVVTGGRNDGGATANAEKAAVAAAISTLRSGLPSARIVVVSPFWDWSPPITPSWLTNIAVYESAAVTAAASPRVTFVPRAYEWLVGLDKAGYFWSLDSIHPNGRGYGVLADGIVAALPDRPDRAP